MCFRFVEETYKLEMGNAQNTQLSKAITVGSEKGVFHLPKGFKNIAVPWCLRLSILVGPSGRVKLAPKVVKASDDAKEVSSGNLEPQDCP
jgi:histone H1/5